MDQGNSRSLRTRLVTFRPMHAMRAFGRGVFARVASLTLTARRLNGIVGRALGLSEMSGAMSPLGGLAFAGVSRGISGGLDSLEARTMLEGSFATAIVVGLDVNGNGNSPGAINPATPSTNNDFYRFVAPAADFVTILADTSNEATTLLDTLVTVYAADQTTIVAQGADNGRLSRGIAKDGWAGFIAQANATYFVVVSGQGTAEGTYTLRVDGETTDFDIGGELPTELGVGRELDSPIPNAPFVPITPILGEISRRQEDIVFRYVVPATQPYDSIVTINAQSTQIRNLGQRLDTRLDVYSATGVPITTSADSDSGRINDAFTTLKADPGEVFFIRVRSDEVANANVNLATGPFFLVIDGMATDVTLNPVTRAFSGAGAFVGFGAPSTNPSDPVPNPAFQTDSYEFTSLGGGTTIIAVQPTGLAPVRDPAIRLYNDEGSLIAFNDNFAGTSSQLEVQLIGGLRYFLVIDGFEINSLVQYTLDIESNHTFDPTVATPNDDHADNPIFGGGAITNAVSQQFNRATSLTWGAPRLNFDGNNNPVRDRGYVADATATGRIYRSGDTDLFKFVPQVDMQHDHPGDNDDAGTSLFIGGTFTVADPNTAHPVGSRSLTSWDADDYWFTGPQFFDAAFDVTYGFNDNTNATSPFAGPVVYTTFDFDPDSTFAPTNGTTDRILMIGGDFTLIVPTPRGPAFFHNVIGWAQNQNTGRWGFVDVVGSTNGAVRAFEVFDPESFDPDGSGNAPVTLDPSGIVLAMGGDFTNVLGGSVNGVYQPGLAGNFLVTFDFETGLVVNVGQTLNAGVRDLTTWNIPDPGAGREASSSPPLLTFVADPYDAPLSLIIGGAFAGGVTTYDGRSLVPLAFGSPSRPTQAFNVVGVVNALQIINDPDPDGPANIPLGTGLQEAAEVLVIAGRFATAGTIANAGNIVKYGRLNTVVAESDPSLPPYTPKLTWERLFTGNSGSTGGAAGTQTSAGTIHDLQLWNPPDLNSVVIPEVLVIAGNFTAFNGVAQGNITAYGFTGDEGDPTAAAGVINIFGIGANAVVRTLATVVGGDEQEPSIAQNLRTGNPQDPLYLGGDFTIVQRGPLDLPVRALGVAQFSAFRGLFADFFNFSSLNGGVYDDVDASDAAPGDVSVYTLNNFDDGDPFSWDHHDRRATRLSITLSPASGAFLNTFVRVYDSNFNIVYGFDRDGSDTISPPFPDPAGMIDFSLGVSQDFTLEGITLWGGETYYIEVSAGPGANGQPAFGLGRYNLRVTADALPPDLPIAPSTVGDGVPDDINARYVAEPFENSFIGAIKITTALGNGDGRNIVNASQQPLRGNATKSMKVTPSLNAAYNFGFDNGNVSTLTDTDLYFFRAEFTGTAEIRLITLGIPDEHGQQVGNVFTGLTTSYTSNFDGAVRIFDNDFQQVGYNNDQTGITGLVQNFTSGDITASFRRTDPRIVINVEAGKQYFIQVESGQRYLVPEPADALLRIDNIAREIDFGTATGSYILNVNAMPQLQQDIDTDNQSVLDDHADALAAAAQSAVFATVIAVSNAGTGSISGIINDTPIKPNDTDLFRFITPGSGALSIVLSNALSTLNAQMSVFFLDPNLGLVFLADGQPSEGGVLNFTTGAQASEEYLIVIDGLDGGQGGYTISVSGVPFVDDHTNFGRIWAATDVKLFDLLGTGEATGNIEVAGDTDVFRFEAITYQRLRATVTALDSSLTPRIDVYEVSEDPSGNPMLLRIGANANTAGLATSGVFFPVAPERIIDVAPEGPGDEDRNYPYYYVVVQAVNPFAGAGRYLLNIAFDPTDDHADGSTISPFTVYDTGEFTLASNVVLDPSNGRGNATGIIEQAGDSDLFRFTAASSGEANVIISRPAGSLLRPKVTIVDANAQIILDVINLPAQAIGEDSDIFFQASVTFNVTRGTNYYVIVEGFNDPDFPNEITSDFGAYTLSLNAPPVDDYPNINEWAISDVQAVITLGSVTGLGQIGGDFGGDAANALINPSNDTDLFNFTTRLAGDHSIIVTPFNTTNGRMAPKVTIFIANAGGGTQVAQVIASSALQEVTVTITGAAANTKYYILVEARSPLAGATPTGEYRLRVQGPTSTGGGNDPTTIDFNNPIEIALAPRDGDGCIDDEINVAGDRDLFRFRSTAAGPVYLQLLTAQGSLLDASISVYNQANELIASRVAFDADGIAGVAATLSFIGTANTSYYAVVDGLGESVGTYQLCINTQPVVNFLYFPEGFASDNTREFVSIINPNSTAATYTVYLRYEMGQPQTVIASGTVGPNSRGGVTIIDGTNFVSPGVIKNTPYSVIIESNLPLGATLAHYDFGSSIGDSFTERLSTQWSFARVERDAGAVLDFITFYNPSNFDIEVTATAYQTDQPAAALTKTFGAQRRGGFSINDIPNFPRGVFSVVVTAKAVLSANNAAFEGIVASLSHYEIGADAAWGLIGEPDGGSRSGAITNFSRGTFSRSEGIFFNNNDVPVTVTLTGSYLRSTLPQFSRTFDINARSQVVFTDADFGLIDGQPVGLSYVSSLPITVNGANYQQGDADSSTAAINAGTRFLFGDAFMDPALAGDKFFEYLYLYNPTASGSAITIKLNFTDGTSSSFNVSVNARGFAEVRLHERAELLSRAGPTWFAVEASSFTPFALSMTHYDLLLGGGWATMGVPLGFVNPISRIP